MSEHSDFYQLLFLRSARSDTIENKNKINKYISQFREIVKARAAHALEAQLCGGADIEQYDYSF